MSRASVPAPTVSVHRHIAPVIRDAPACASDARIVGVRAIERRKNRDPRCRSLLQIASAVAATKKIAMKAATPTKHKCRSTMEILWLFAQAIAVNRCTINRAGDPKTLERLVRSIQSIQATNTDRLAQNCTFDAVAFSFVCRTITSSYTRDVCRSNLHGRTVGEDRQVAEDHLFRAVDRRPGGFMGGGLGGRSLDGW